MENKPLQTIHTFRLNWKELEEATEEEKAAFLGVGFCLNEVNSLKKLALHAMHFVPGNPRLEGVTMIQRNMLLRTLTAKLFEFFGLFNSISSRGRNTPSIRRVVESLKEQQRECRKHKGFLIAEKIRNSQAAHYDFDSIVKIVKEGGLEGNCDFHFTPELSNNFFPFAEKSVFNGDPAGVPAGELTKEYADSVTDAWIEWTLKASDLVRSTFEKLFEELVFTRFPKRKAYSTQEWLDTDLKANSDFRLPLFVASR